VVGRGGVPEGIYSSTAEIQDRRATTYPAETRLPCPGTVYPAGKLPTCRAYPAGAPLPCREVYVARSRRVAVATLPEVSVAR